MLSQELFGVGFGVLFVCAYNFEKLLYPFVLLLPFSLFLGFVLFVLPRREACVSVWFDVFLCTCFDCVCVRVC